MSCFKTSLVVYFEASLFIVGLSSEAIRNLDGKHLLENPPVVLVPDVVTPEQSQAWANFDSICFELFIFHEKSVGTHSLGR